MEAVNLICCILHTLFINIINGQRESNHCCACILPLLYPLEFIVPQRGIIY